MHENLIKLLSEALKFYAEDANYVNGQIEKDKGHQAKFILNLVKQNDDQMKNYEKEYDEIKKATEKETTAEDLMKMIEEMKNLE